MSDCWEIIENGEVEESDFTEALLDWLEEDV